MNKISRILVTENPEGNYQWLHNMTKIKNKEVFLREYDEGCDISIVDYCKKACKEKCDIDQEGTAEDFAENMDCDCPVALVYHMAVGHAELRNMLGRYESSGLSLDELKDRTCTWSEDDEGTWSCSKCTAVWVFTDSSPGENEMKYCPECGRKIVDITPYNVEEE